MFYRVLLIPAALVLLPAIGLVIGWSANYSAGSAYCQ